MGQKHRCPRPQAAGAQGWGRCMPREAQAEAGSGQRLSEQCPVPSPENMGSGCWVQNRFQERGMEQGPPRHGRGSPVTRLRGWLRAAPAGIPRSLLPVPPLAGLCSPSSLLPAHTCKPHPRREFVGLLTSPPTLFHALNTDGFRSAVANKLSHACRSQAGVGVRGTS